LRIKDL